VLIIFKKRLYADYMLIRYYVYIELLRTRVQFQAFKFQTMAEKTAKNLGGYFFAEPCV